MQPLRRFPPTALTAVLAIVLCALPALGAKYFVDPQAGLIANDGSSAHPWNTLAAVASAKTFAAGDSIFLRTGYHGAVAISGTYVSPVTFLAEPGQVPVLRSLRVNTARNLIFAGLTLTPEAATPYTTGDLVYLTSTAAHVTVQACTLYSTKNSSAWDSSAWNTLTCNAFRVDGPGDAIRGNDIRNVNFGISVSGDSCLVEYNRVENFEGDGLRGLGDYGVFQYNFITGCIATSANHDDGFQSWSNGAGGVGTDTVRGVVLRGNTIINNLDPNQPLRGTLQGIGCFDGYYKDWVVENNVVCVDMWHGISLYGAINCRIVNNTVCDENYASPGPPWIGIFDHKDSTHSSGCVIRNNLSNAYSIGAGVVSDHNRTMANTPAAYDAYFVDRAHFDFHLKATAPCIDSGSTLLAPPTDRDGTARPSGNGVDNGAYEYVRSPGIDRDAGARHLAAPAIRVLGNPVGRVASIRCGAGVRTLRVYRMDGTLAGCAAVGADGRAEWKTDGCRSGLYLICAGTDAGTTRTARVMVLK